jgi:hypothetical protein
VTKRKPLTWYDTGNGRIPDCTACCDLLFAPLFAEAVYSTAIEHPGDPTDMAQRAINTYHESGHQDP